MTIDRSIARESIDEAISSLGLVTGEATDSLIKFMPDCVTYHPKAICTDYRKKDPQISDANKKGLGIRRNGFMSEAALLELTEKGKLDPLKAHETTLLRAWFSYLRNSKLLAAPVHPDQYFELSGMFGDQCPGCARLDHQIVSKADAPVWPPDDCNRDACALGVDFKIDFAAELVRSERKPEGSGVIRFIRSLFGRN